ncbi:MAG: class I SAM-dependent methyltransferase family protein [Elusimicrobia bacterium]|nr:class I SAM-dependent methyltransferase family protein [Elusimicrobiota bacterium]
MIRSTEHEMKLEDGTRLFYRAWLPARPADRAVILFHRGHEHSGRWDDTVDALGLPDTAFFAWDARGHGRSDGPRGHAAHFGVFARDADEWARHVARESDIALDRMVVMAQSVGAVIAAAWAHDYAPPLAGLVLGAPAFRVRLYLPGALAALRLYGALTGRTLTIRSYVRPGMLTHDPEQARRYTADPLISAQIASNILVGLRDTSDRLIEDAAAIQAPTLVLTAGADWVVDQGAQRRFFDNLSSPVKSWLEIPGAYHALWHERDRERSLAPAREFIAACFRKPAKQVSLLQADQSGPTLSEHDRLAQPLPWTSWKRWVFAAQRLLMGSFGRLSAGIRIGWRTGFDSGETLDYVYANAPRGTTPLGRLIDRSYLDSLGWRGIRLRKVHLAKLIKAAIAKVRAQGKPVRIVDIASGPGRYVLEVMKELPGIEMSALLRDYEERNLEAGRNLARALGVRHATFALGDAFDRRSLAAVSPRPTIAVVSGLYELVPENGKVLDSLRGLADAMEDGGMLIYTNQPWHPQLEFIARVLTNREGKPWIMRRRSQAEMDELVRAAGFNKLSMEADGWGIFTVSLAERRP